jgi:hypothetical protein
MRVRWEIIERVSFDALGATRVFMFSGGGSQCSNTRSIAALCLTVESRLAWAKKSVNRVYFPRIHFQMGASDASENIFFFVFNGLNFHSRCQDVNR